MKSIKEIKKQEGNRILLRAGFDVPIENGKVVDSERILAILPTIKYLMKKGPLIIMSHQGRPEGKRMSNLSLLPIVSVLEKELKIEVLFSKETIGKKTERLTKKMTVGEVLLLENLRFYKGEEKNDSIFAKNLSKLGDIYVNEAFPDTHREHASIVGVPKYIPGYAGFQLQAEIKHLDILLNKIKHPFLVILGGAKFETKLPVITRFLNSADSIFIGGALSNQVFRELGYETGISLIEEKKFGLKKIIQNQKISIPLDVVAIKGKSKTVKNPINLDKKDNMLDIGPMSVKYLCKEVKKAKLILWNGPLGKSPYLSGTKKILETIAKSKAVSIIGGGDTVEFISKYKMGKKFTFVSTGGGAMLEYLSKGTLPGIKALK